MNGENRKNPRVRRQLRVELRPKRFGFLGGPTEVAETLDVSRGGVRINTKSELKVGSQLLLLVRSKFLRRILRFNTRVVWARKKHHEGITFTQAGLRFLPLDADQSMMVFRLVTGQRSA